MKVSVFKKLSDLRDSINQDLRESKRSQDLLKELEEGGVLQIEVSLRVTTLKNSGSTKREPNGLDKVYLQ